MSLSAATRNAILDRWNSTDDTARDIASHFKVEVADVRNIIQIAQRAGAARKREQWRYKVKAWYANNPEHCAQVAKRNAERWADPDTARKLREAMTAEGKGRAHLRNLTAEQRERYRELRRQRYTPADALATVTGGP